MSTHTDQTIATMVRARLAAAQDAAESLAPDSSWLRLCQRINIAEAIGGLTRERRTGQPQKPAPSLRSAARWSRGTASEFPGKRWPTPHERTLQAPAPQVATWCRR